ncbi:SH3 domain-containing protein [Treponema sp.]|uniref:SH3 domain-containing protein n=1 Tax=Treponema sp. TaxID=166 RepID=UPI0025EFC84F|nr:SH3 domain-containing protein [Treponema sp.]
MKKMITIFILLFSLFVSQLFGESNLDLFIEAWGNEYSEQEINFIKELNGDWIPFNYLDWYKEGNLIEKTKEINTNFSMVDFESLSLSFIKDVVICSFPYGIKTYEVSEIEETANIYCVELLYNDYADDLKKEKFITSIWKSEDKKEIFTFDFQNNFLLVTNVSNNKRQKYLKIPFTEKNKLLEIIKSKKYRPFLYFDEIIKVSTDDSFYTNVSKNKTMLVNENLKLRSGEASSTQVLVVMQAGTKVKILELGKAETIDGISSNWVKIEVQAGAKDRDGKPIKAGTIGWCYGGYLK